MKPYSIAFVGVTILLVLSFIDTTAQKKSIRWMEGKPLKWSDFKGPADGSIKYSALTASGISYSYQTNKKGELVFTIESHFDPSNSWVKKDKKKKKLLEHEQRHFDITELYARKLKKDISTRNFSHTKSLQKKLNKLYQSWVKKLSKEQKSYDKETNHSVNQENQQMWDKKIKSELAGLKNYTHSRIVKKLSK